MTEYNFNFFLTAHILVIWLVEQVILYVALYMYTAAAIQY